MRDNAIKFKKESDVLDIILARQRGKQPHIEMADICLEEQMAVSIEDIVSADENEQSGEIINGEDRELIAWDIEVLEPTEPNARSGVVLN